MTRRKLTPVYILFFLLLWPDTWRILMGVAMAGLMGPGIIPPDLGPPGSWMFYFMLATIGYSVFAVPARGITNWLKKLIIRLNNGQM